MCDKKECPIYNICDKSKEQISICNETEENLKEFSYLDTELDQFLDFATN